MRGAGFPLGAAPGRARGASGRPAGEQRGGRRPRGVRRGEGRGPRRGGRPQSPRAGPGSRPAAGRCLRPRRPPPRPRPRSLPTCRSSGSGPLSSPLRSGFGAGERLDPGSPDVTARPHLRSEPCGENGVKFLQVPLCSLGRRRCPDTSRSCRGKTVCRVEIPAGGNERAVRGGGEDLSSGPQCLLK